MNIKTRIKKTAFSVCGAVLFFTAHSAYAKIRFEGIDLTYDNKLIFSIQHNTPCSPTYKSLFTTSLGENKITSYPKILTCFPEKMESLHEGRTLQIRNRYGTAWYAVSSEKLRWISYSNKLPDDYVNVNTVSASPNGDWTCTVEQTGNATGRLMLMNTKSLEQVILSDSADFKFGKVNAKWSPDSRTLLYEKEGNIYFITPNSLSKKSVSLPESYRKIGAGNINSVSWTKNGAIIFIDNDIIYRINSNELYTRGLYSSLVGSGTIVGRLPSAYNKTYDNFWCNEDGTRILIIAKNKIVYSYSIESIPGFSYAKTLGIYSLTDIDGVPLEFDVFWSQYGEPVLWLTMLTYDKSNKKSGLYLLGDKMKLLTEARNSIMPSVSPDGQRIAFTDENYLCTYDVWNVRTLAKLGDERVLSVCWKTNSSLFVGGENTVRLLNMFDTDNPYKFLFLSSSGRAFWYNDNIYSMTGKDTFIYDAEKNIWNETTEQTFRNAPSEKNDFFRVFTGDAANSRFENALYVRSLSGGLTTYSVYNVTDFEVPDNRKVSLVFDAVDDAEGLAKILSVLDTFNIKSTFFINGEFIRRYPMETKQIAMSENECASGFYSTRDLVMSDFSIDEEFVKRGLARNEDEFFSVTGQELSLLWHAPNYHDSQMIRSAGSKAGYRYVIPYMKVSDRITYETMAKDENQKYMSTKELIDAFVANLHTGMIIPVTIGRSYGTRNDYLYENIDLLIMAILESGYQITDLRNLN